MEGAPSGLSISALTEKLRNSNRQLHRHYRIIQNVKGYALTIQFAHRTVAVTDHLVDDVRTLKSIFEGIFHPMTEGMETYGRIAKADLVRCC